MKLRREWHRRVEDNAKAVEVLEAHSLLWCRALGPEPAKLRWPAEADLHAAQHAAQTLAARLDKNGPRDEDLDAHMENVVQAANAIKLLSWDAIHRERFSLTPSGL